MSPEIYLIQRPLHAVSPSSPTITKKPAANCQFHNGEYFILLTTRHLIPIDKCVNNHTHHLDYTQ